MTNVLNSPVSSNPITIYKNEVIELYWHVGSGPMSSQGKGLKIKCAAPNPFTKKPFFKYAGWLGVSLAIHSGTKTPVYILEAATKEIKNQKDIIFQKAIDFLSEIGMPKRAEEFRQANAKGAGSSVSHKPVKNNSKRNRRGR